LRETDRTRPSVEFRSTEPSEPELFASSFEAPPRRSGLSTWFAAAAALVLGIVIGFASGYRAGKGATAAALTTEKPSPTSGGGQTFSESAVSEPVNLNTAPIVPAPATATTPPPPSTKPAAAPAPSKKALAEPAAPAPPKKAVAEPPEAVSPKKAVVKPVVPKPTVPEPASPAGPGSLQVVSRPAGAQVVLDGRAVGRTPMTIPDVSQGEHRIQLDLPGFKAWATSVDVKAGSQSRVAASLEQ
jgi:hypothetical protein